MAEFGLPDHTTDTIRRILAEVPAVEKAVIYGSRAKGNFRTGSDIDLTLFGQGLDLATLGAIAARLDESPIPYQVDLSLRPARPRWLARAHRAGGAGVLRAPGGCRSPAVAMEIFRDNVL